MTAFFSNRRQQTDETEVRPLTTLPHQPVGFDTVIGSTCHIEGKFMSSGNVRFDGKFSGTLEISGNILVGETADISAEINARNISIAGTVRGNVTGHKVQLLRTGKIWGDISASALTTEEGAFIDGKITMMGHSATRPPTAKEVAEHLEVIEEADDSTLTSPAWDDTLPESETLPARPDFIDTTLLASDGEESDEE